MQRHQLATVNKDDLIDNILASSIEEGKFAAIKLQLDEVIKEMQALKDMVLSPDSLLKENYSELKSRVDKQDKIIAKQQQFLEHLDRKEREANIISDPRRGCYIVLPMFIFFFFFLFFRHDIVWPISLEPLLAETQN